MDRLVPEPRPEGGDAARGSGNVGTRGEELADGEEGDRGFRALWSEEGVALDLGPYEIPRDVQERARAARGEPGLE